MGFFQQKFSYRCTDTCHQCKLWGACRELFPSVPYLWKRQWRWWFWPFLAGDVFCLLSLLIFFVRNGSLQIRHGAFGKSAGYAGVEIYEIFSEYLNIWISEYTVYTVYTSTPSKLIRWKPISAPKHLQLENIFWTRFCLSLASHFLPSWLQSSLGPVSSEHLQRTIWVKPQRIQSISSKSLLNSSPPHPDLQPAF